MHSNESRNTMGPSLTLEIDHLLSEFTETDREEEASQVWISYNVCNIVLYIICRNTMGPSLTLEIDHLLSEFTETDREENSSQVGMS